MSTFFSLQYNLIYLVVFCLVITSCQNDDEVSNNDIIKLRVLNLSNEEITETIGDGQTIITLEATVPKDVDDSFKTVTFKTSEGEFISSTVSDDDTRRVDNDGKARVSLKVPLGNEPLFISARIGSNENLYMAEKVLTLISVNQVIDLVVLNVDGQELAGGVKADGETVLLLKATVLANVDQLDEVTLKTSGGEFQENNDTEIKKTINNQHQVLVPLKVPKDVGLLYFSASVGSNPVYFDELNMSLERARADTLTIEPSMIEMNTQQGNALNVYLLRNQGFVSIGTSAIFKAVQNISNEEVQVGRFTGLANAATDNEGKITVSFYADTNDIQTDQPVIIKVHTTNDAGGIVDGEITLTII